MKVFVATGGGAVLVAGTTLAIAREKLEQKIGRKLKFLRSADGCWYSYKDQYETPYIVEVVTLHGEGE